ncbi:gliding motility-associated ABC transporter permease subunit GldF [Flavimarina sp. Hel_I_48]|uniref:gliding motility-associated ABC transporter permease subunit GldF n=1 Tax=Flavimarina sp. Hel_I_48 TaxID=1392488 RepID=UPI0004DF68DB|nr:gliding motility-associated ABC transporter permease subunit GldF [Flavimarina sp. Hel_I_48]
MLAIFKKEINSFFATLTGYLVIGVFLLMTGLFLWVFEGEFNVFDYGYADLTPFFQLCPWIFMFLIPAVTMRSLSDERRSGTLELLLTKPLGETALVMGKFLAASVLLCIALLPTLVYVYAIDQLGNPVGNYDAGVVLGSYVGLLFLAMAYTAIGIFASSLAQNQIVAFIIAVLISFMLYYGLALLGNFEILQQWSLRGHFDSVARGVLDTRDLLYFISITALFLFFTVLQLKSRR